MSVQYQTTVDWDLTLRDLEYTDASTMPAAMQGLVQFAIKVTTGAPATTAGKFIRGAIVQNAFSGVNYQNTGTTATPIWSIIDVAVGGLPALPNGQVWVGNVGNVATAVAPSGDVSMLNTGAFTVDGIQGVPVPVAATVDASMYVFDSTPGQFNPVIMSGDATMDNLGAVTVAKSSSVNFEVTGGVVNAGGTLAAGFYPTVAAPQALSGPGAILLTSYQTQFTSTGTGDALSLANGTKIGQLKKVSYIAEGAGADTGVITPVAGQGFTTATLNAIGDYIVFMWNGAAWLPVDFVGVTVV